MTIVKVDNSWNIDFSEKYFMITFVENFTEYNFDYN